VYVSAAKSKTPLLADSNSKKGQAKLALFWNKGNETPRPNWFCVGFTQFEARLFLASNPKTTRQKEANFYFLPYTVTGARRWW
jgi:hypothetical protein